MRSGAPAIRVEAVRALAALGLPAAIRSMLGALEDPVVAVRVAVVRALEHTTRADVVDRLAGAMTDPNLADVRIEVCATLASLDTSHAAPMLTQLAVDRDAAVSAAAVASLVTLPDAEGLSAVVSVWPSITPEARGRVRSCGRGGGDRGQRRGTRRDRPARDADGLGTRARAARACGPRARPLLWMATAHAELISRALEDPDGRVRLAAVQVLGELELERVRRSGSQAATRRSRWQVRSPRVAGRGSWCELLAGRACHGAGDRGQQRR